MSAMDFDELTDQARRALDAITNGDPTGYQELFSDDESITLGNPFGGFARGRTAVYEQLERAASYYMDGRATSIENVGRAVGSDVAYTVEFEHFEARVGGHEHSQVALRVTCVYRREADGWKLVHRHADPLVDRQSPDSVIQR